MHYGFGITFSLENKFTALNGSIQYYKVAAKVDLVAAAPADVKNPTVAEQIAHAVAQANYLRLLEALRTLGGQPVIVAAEGKEVQFTLEQPNVYGDNSIKQVSRHSFVEESVEAIKKIFADESCGFEMKALKAESEEIEDIKDLVIVEAEEALVDVDAIEVKPAF